VADQSLYRRHRPQSFSEVVGQEHVVRTLSNAIERDRVTHAYLFVGSRGTGKTSMAKILARSLNCVDGPTLTPCGKCESCITIASGTSMDVIEMDAASNRSVDDIRDLRERVGYAPAAGGWKVYILDEAHMLTREAWNAFLKTLEEPPPNTVFVLATTEAHKVMPTIVDRCQRFDFARPTPENIAEVLRRASSAEGITIADDAIGAVARAANGSFRDALGTLDQLVAYSGSEIATSDVLSVLGVTDSDLLFRAAGAIAAGDGRGVLELAAELAGTGRDPSRFATDLIAHLRRLLVIKTLDEVPSHFFVAPDEAQRLQSQATELGEVELIRAIDELSAAVAAVREGDEARMTIELAMLRAARPEIDPSSRALAHRLERIERAMDGSGTAPTVASTGASDPPPAADAPPSDPPPAADAPPPADNAPATSAGDDPGPEAAAPANPVEAIAQGAQGAVATAGQVVSDIGVRVEEARVEVETRVEEVRTGVETRVEEVRTEVETRVAATAQATGDALNLERLAGLWPAVVDQVRTSGSEFLSAPFEEARPVAVNAEAATVEIGFPPSAAFNKRKAEAKESRDGLTEALRTIVGSRLNPTYVMIEEEEAPAADVDGGGAPAPSGVDESELVERFKAEFDAEEVIEHPEEGES
jgi:DNA polymerase-3 subunit gamma/tau